MNTLRETPAAMRWRFPALLGSRTLRETIETHENNYTLIRLILSASVIYFHSFFISPGYYEHISGVLVPLTSVGGLAVQMFFFLSGLFVAQSFHKDSRIPSFVLKRFLRIWPGLFVCLLVTASVIAMVSGRPFVRFLTFGEFYDYVLRNSVFDLTWNIDGLLQSNTLHGLNGSIHTLPMEAKMYVVLAVIGALDMMRTSKRIAIAGAVTFALVLTPVVWDLIPFNLLNADYSRDAAALFLAGVVVYGLSSWIRPALWQGAILIPAALPTHGSAHAFLFFASAVWIMLMVGQSKWVGRLWRPRNDLSYGIYIYGWPSQQIVMAITPIHLTPYVLTIVALALATGFAALSWRYVEKPAMRFGKAFTDKPVVDTLKKHQRIIALMVMLTALCIAASFITNRMDVAPVAPMQVRIVDFGPHESRAGTPINQQSNGESALWLKLEGKAPERAVVVMDGERLTTQVGGEMATAKVDASILSTPGEKTIFLERRYADRIERSNMVEMRILPLADSAGADKSSRR
ncbi:acyltransferase family protein [Paraburkholderia caribensis]|uniref:acyltransferase family protein n=1 Tax=Paraburkholderia caribensis TaxID=75105 RepID=UPI001590F770|nr:acyltransferase [Paraburkholderia caribensis]